MKIAIVGAGNVGGTLGRGWATKGHEILFGVRHPNDPKFAGLLDSVEGRAKVLPLAEACADAVVVVLASPWPTVPDVLHKAGDLSDKILIDCNNPLNPDLKSLSIGTTTSAGEMIARWASGAKVVKCFNTIGAARMADPIINGIPITMPYCGDDDDAKSVVHTLAAELGFDPIDVGKLSMSRVLEPVALLWITLAIHGGWGTDFAVQLLRRSPARS